VVWELVFMLVILKIPVVYLCWVVWWAIRAEPEPLEGAARLAPLPVRPQAPECTWRRRRREPVRRGPRGGGRSGGRGRIAYARGRLAP
jgi:hypothetical protein